MAKSPLRLEQYDTVLYNANLNPMGVPKSVSKAIVDNADSVVRYPNEYYPALKKSISKYAGCNESQIILASGSTDMLRQYCSLVSPKTALVLEPTSSEYAAVLTAFDCAVETYKLDEATDFNLDVVDFVSNLNSSYDILIIGNPNNPTSQFISREDIETIAQACELLEIFLVIDEMYIEFTEHYKDITCVPLINDYQNLAVLRSVSKFFAVPGLRLAYSIMSSTDNADKLKKVSPPNTISSLTACVCSDMFSDSKYIEESRSQIYTERNLIFSAMGTNKNIKIYKPFANFMLAKILKDDLTAAEIADHCKLKGIVIRNCSDINGLDNKYIRFCFMKPAQNDMLVNTILELFK